MSDRLGAIREAVMGAAGTRAVAEALVEELLAALDGIPDGEVVSDVAGVRLYGPEDGFPELTAGEVRERLRWTLAEIAARDAT